MRDEAAEALRRCNEIVERLRAPGGCPWDREQTHRSLAPYLLEETYETLDTIGSSDGTALREELGDLLLQVMMHCAIAAEHSDGFDIGDVADGVRAKMVHRHPHVFANTEVNGAADVVVNWEKLKAAEKQGRLSILDGVPLTLPALAYTQALQKRPARVGFDEQPTVVDALRSLRAAMDHLVEQIPADAPPAARGADWVVDEGAISRSQGAPAGSHVAPPQPSDALTAAVGDLLFAAVAVARRLRVDSELALRSRAGEFAERFRGLEDAARSEGLDLHDLGPAEWQKRWGAGEPGGSDAAP